MTHVVKIEFNSETASKLANLPEIMKNAAIEALEQQAHVMVGLAQVNVRVDTGALRDSIRVERGGEGLFWNVIRVRAGGYQVNPKTGRLVDYAAFVEAQYPFMAPAWESIRDDTLEIITLRVKDAIEAQIT